MKSIPIIVVWAALLLSAACHSTQTKGSAASGDDTTQVRINVPVSDTTASQVAALLDGYYALKDAFIKSDTALADAAARNLRRQAAGIGLAALADDPARHDEARTQLGSLDAEITGLLGEETLLGKRQEFQLISDITYNLIKATGMKDRTVYRDYCPMFNEGNGAFWLSNARPIANPYYGAEMPDCGTLRETISF